MKRSIHQLIMPAVKLYWRIFKPQSYGVKVVIIHPEYPDKILLVRHSYGNTTLWNVPGGGYNPEKETAEAAAAREIREELDAHILQLRQLGEYQTTAEGKRDTVLLFSGTIENPEDIKTSPEISSLDWVEMRTLSNRETDVARVAKRAVERVLSSDI